MSDGVTQEMIKSKLLYNREFGRLIWLPRPRDDFGDQNKWSVWNSRYSGCFAGNVNSKGYRCINIFGKMRKASRLTWLYHYGDWPNVVDHIDGDTLNDRVENLRDVTQLENCHNKRVSICNEFGVPGVYRDGPKFRAEISFNGKKIYLGNFPELPMAVAARKEAERRFGYHENNGRIVS